MVKIKISDSKNKKSNFSYIKNSLNELFNSTRCVIETSEKSRFCVTIETPSEFEDIIKCELADKVAEIITVNYKYDFLKKRLKITGLNNEEKEILIASLIAADLEDDSKYVYGKIKGIDNFVIDGIFNFRLRPLIKKWEDVLNYVPECFINSQLKDFISYLLMNKNKRVYVDNGKVFDNHFKRLYRASLLGFDELKIVREIILSNCGEVELSGNIPDKDESFLKEYYEDKLIFSS